MTEPSNNFQAKKSLGQNFLDAPHIIRQMIQSAGLIDAENPVVLEVGPGKGVLTRELLATNPHTRVVAIEKDDRAIPFLQEQFTAEIKSGRLVLIHADILTFDPSGLSAGQPCNGYVIVANIPYYITGEFIRKFLESTCGPKKMVLMVQKEVAERIVGADGRARKDEKGTKESILSISVKAYGTPHYITTVPATYFTPMPKVDSAVLLIDQISKDFFASSGTDKSPRIDTKSSLNEATFFTIVKNGFAHKRKVLINNLETLAPREILAEIWKKIGLSPKVRAEELSLEQWKQLTELLPPIV